MDLFNLLSVLDLAEVSPKGASKLISLHLRQISDFNGVIFYRVDGTDYFINGAGFRLLEARGLYSGNVSYVIIKKKKRTHMAASHPPMM